jgi:CheY-like chemotaxis protein
MSAAPAILVATDAVGDADLIAGLLSQEFSNVERSTVPDLAVQDFEKHRPAVLVLAFDALERAERYYLGLYRLCKVIHEIPHRTLILCHKDELQRVYELCRKEYFDDYVMFWPLNHDAPRLRMGVHMALRQLASSHSAGPRPAEFASEARRLGKEESSLSRLATQGKERVENVERTMQSARQEIGSTFAGLAQKLSRPEWNDVVQVKDVNALELEMARIKDRELEPRMRAVEGAVGSVQSWAGSVQVGLASRAESMRALQDLAGRLLPMILLVDDDPFQLKLLQSVLGGAGLQLALAESGAEALATIRKRRPDLILLDIGLPDTDGVALTRQLKAIPQYASVPILIITGNSDREVVLQSIKAGAAGFVVKPIAKDALLRKIRDCLGQGEPALGAGVTAPA